MFNRKELEVIAVFGGIPLITYHTLKFTFNCLYITLFTNTTCY